MNFDQFFTQFQSQESIAILFFLIIAFLFGFLAGSLSRRSRIKRLEKDIAARHKEITDLQAEMAGLREQLDLQDADLRKAGFDLQEREDKVNRLEAEKARFNNQLTDLKSELEKAKATNNTYAATIEDLSDQIVGLKAKNKDLQYEVEHETESTAGLAEVQSIYNATRTRLEAMDDKLARLESENQELRSALIEIKEGAFVAERSIPTQPPATDARVEEDPVLDLSQSKKVLGEKILTNGPERDDLTHIEGLGPFLEKKLNEIGVYTFEDIAAWDTDRIAEVTQLIGFIPGRIEQDDWVGQARHLSQKKEEDPTAFLVATAPAPPDDLTVIEGIGPKIEEILKDAGILTWEDLAESNPGHLTDILLTAGDHYHVHDPSTWPAQASLAANGNWELLQEYQEQLRGGREVEKEEEGE